MYTRAFYVDLCDIACYDNKMNDIQIYSVIMFIVGAFFTKAVFYFEQKHQTKKFYTIISAVILQILDSVYSCHKSAIEYNISELKKLETKEEIECSEYLQRETNKVSVFMEIYTLLLIRAVPRKGRKYINYKTWPEARSLIEQLRGLIDNEKDQS